MSSAPIAFLELKRSPPIGRSYLRALLGVSKPRTADSLPPLAVSRCGVRIDPGAVARFRALFELVPDGPVPASFAHLLAWPLQIYLLTHPGFPLRVLGTVHLRNSIVQARALRPNESLDVRVHVASLRSVPRGVEYQLHTEICDARGRAVWREASTYLAPGGSARVASVAPVSGPASAALAVPTPADRSTYPSAWFEDAAGAGREFGWHFDLPAATGRRYAGLSGDWNPIHITAATARLFGFRAAIAHGMWTCAKVLALIEARLPDPALTLDVHFRRPIFLPGRACLRLQAAPDGCWHWLVQDRRGATTHAQGTHDFPGRALAE
jgi:acyl dehydratase